MCGIAGVVVYDESALAPSRVLVNRLCAEMARRGPDAAGELVSSDGAAVLGHRRLAIIDLTSAGNQPMVDDETGCILVFNGEIYNFRQLRSELQSVGYTFRSDSDSEVLLKGYRRWGADLLRKVRGMYAFALWDPLKQALWLARDPYGIKPLYYAELSDRFVFCSQVKPLRQHAVVDDSPEPAGVVGFLLLGSVPEPYTFYRGIRCLPAGHEVWIRKGMPFRPSAHASVSGVWRSAALAPIKLDDEEVRARVRAAVADSVTAHQVSDVPVGAFLSAGIDSGALVGLMAEGRNAPLQTVTLGFSSFIRTGLDETILAAETARHYGTSHQTVWITDAEAEREWPNALRDMDQPSIDGFNTWLVSKYTAAAGLKVAVSGVGGDELFGGYSHFARLASMRRGLRPLSAVKGLLPLLAAGARLAHGAGLVHAKAEGIARAGPDMAGLYFVKRGLFMPGDLNRLVDANIVREGLAALDLVATMRAAIDGFETHDFASVAALETVFYLRNQLLRDSDWASTAHSLELRTPLVDFSLLRELAHVLAAEMTSTSMSKKRLLAQSPRPSLPNSVMNREKSGFALPMNRWIDRSEVLTNWRLNTSLTGGQVHWSRKMAYSLVAQAHPQLVIST